MLLLVLFYHSHLSCSLTLGEYPFKCKYCEKTFNHRSHLNVHIRTHTGERPYKCHLCTKEFSRKIGLRQHLRTHGITEDTNTVPTNSGPVNSGSAEIPGYYELDVMSVLPSVTTVVVDSSDNGHNNFNNDNFETHTLNLDPANIQVCKHKEILFR